jgi:hypothetical protein
LGTFCTPPPRLPGHTPPFPPVLWPWPGEWDDGACWRMPKKEDHGLTPFSLPCPPPHHHRPAQRDTTLAFVPAVAGRRHNHPLLGGQRRRRIVLVVERRVWRTRASSLLFWVRVEERRALLFFGRSK